MTTAGLFFTLGKIMPPLRNTDFVGVELHTVVVADVVEVPLDVLLILLLDEVE